MGSASPKELERFARADFRPRLPLPSRIGCAVAALGLVLSVARLTLARLDLVELGASGALALSAAAIACALGGLGLAMWGLAIARRHHREAKRRLAEALERLGRG